MTSIKSCSRPLQASSSAATVAIRDIRCGDRLFRVVHSWLWEQRQRSKNLSSRKAETCTQIRQFLRLRAGEQPRLDSVPIDRRGLLPEDGVIEGDYASHP